MTITIDKVSVWAVSKHCCPDTLDVYQSKSRDLLSALQQVHPVFGDLVIVGRHGPVTIANDLHGLEELIEAQVFDEQHPADYQNVNAEGRLMSQSLSRIGFSISYGSFNHANRDILPLERGGIDMRVRGCSAGPESNSNIVLDLPTNIKSDIHGLDVAKRLLKLFIDVWGCSFGGVSIEQYRQTVRAGDTDSYAGQWLFYLPFPSLAKHLPNDIASMASARGTLVETTPHLPDVRSASDLAAGVRVRDALDDLGFIRNATYAITGWPPDKEETLYEQFISGAPAGRKYAVHCVNFDGYDPDRKVLLYAKLFRRLRRHPKEWGLRGWDGPVLNEAKRQVRAAAKAGGVPIEWHVGLEEPAHQVRQLLADHTSITEQQLRVIYTPPP